MQQRRKGETARISGATPRVKRTQKNVQWVSRLMAKYRSVEYARHSAQALAREALAEFDNAYGCVPDSEDKEFIRQLVIYMIERDI